MFADITPGEASEDSGEFLNHLKNNVDYNIYFELRPYAQWVASVERPLRLLGEASIDAGYKLSKFARLKLDAFGRIPLDTASSNLVGKDNAIISPLGDVREFFVEFFTSEMSLSVGRLIIPWRGLPGCSLSDRVNPHDYRRGPNFISGIEDKVPQWGFDFQTSIDGYGIEFLTFVNYLPRQGSLIASEQGGYSLGQYQAAIYDNLTVYETQNLKHAGNLERSYAYDYSLQPTIGGRFEKSFGRFDISFNTLWAPNELPATLFKDDSKPRVSALSFAGNFRIDLGAAILDVEFLAAPAASTLGGKTVLVLLNGGDYAMRQVDYYAFGVGAEATLGDAFSGSLSIVNSMWAGLQQGDSLWRVDSTPVTNDLGIVNRTAVILNASGKISDFPWWWDLSAEIGLWRIDSAIGFKTYYTFEKPKISLGLFLDVFFGYQGSPNYFRQDSSAAGLYLSHEL